jgi:predicted DNA-binding transcriptional regulator AlpA
VPSWAFIGARSANSLAVPASPCVRAVLPLIASTQQILELRNQGLSWNEVAERVGMTVQGVWSRFRRARPPKPPRLGRQQVLIDALDQNLAIGVRAAVVDDLGRSPTRLNSPLPDEPPTI